MENEGHRDWKRRTETVILYRQRDVSAENSMASPRSLELLSLARSHDTRSARKNPAHFDAPTMKSEIKNICDRFKENEILRYKSHKTCTESITLNVIKY